MAKEKKAVQELKNSSLYMAIKDDLLNQLEKNGNNTEYYRDLVLDYMDFWIIKSLLSSDIKARGVVVTYNNGGGQKGKKKNESIAELNKTNAQMLKLLQELGITPSNAIGDDDYEL